MTIKRLILLALVSMTFFKTKSQDIEFSQFYNSPLYLNPAFTGVGIGPRFVLNYRNQWPSLNNAFVSYAASYDQYIDPISGGIGFLAMADNQGSGLYRTFSFSGMYAYQISVNDNLAVKAGFSASVNQSSLRYSDLLFYDMIDQQTGAVVFSTNETGPSALTKTYFDAGAGMLVYSKKVFFGIGVKHLTQPTISFYNNGKSLLPIRIAANLGYEFKKKKNSKGYFAPNILYVQQGTFNQLNVGGYLGIHALNLGLALRHDFSNSDALILTAGIKKGIFKTAYSYDATISNLKGKSGGAHELSLIFNIGDSPKAERKRYMKRLAECPNIF